MPGEIEQLVIDTLFDRRKAKKESCLGVNEAGIELLAGTQEALPVIEGVLRNVVIPDLTRPASAESRFYGLNYVLGAYLVISRKADTDRAVPFLRELPQPILLEAIGAVSAFFNKMKDGYNFGVSPGKQLMDFLKELTVSHDPALRDLAERVVEQMRSQDPGCWGG